MRARDVVQLVAGSLVVYVAVVSSQACGPHGNSGMGSGGSGGSITGMGGSGGIVASSGRGGAGGHGVSGAGGTGGIMNPVPDAYAEQSGTRIKAKWRVGEDGSKEFVGWWDSQLQIDCTWALMDDGVEHCRPTDFGTVDTEGFSDSNCMLQQKFVSYFEQPCKPPKYALTTTTALSPLCSNIQKGIRHYADVGQIYGGKIYKLNGSMCYEVSTVGASIYTIGPELPASTFASSSVIVDK